MTIRIFKDYHNLSLQVAGEIISIVKDNPKTVLCLAAGDTPRLAYSLLAEHAKSEKIDFSKCTFIGLDEWIGIPPENSGSCSFFLNNNVFKLLGIGSSQVHVFDALAKDPEGECRKMDTVIREKGGIDLMLVGVGMNGHIGFNEPGVSENLYSHVVPLDETTQTVGQKYFTTPMELRSGITLGLQHFLESRRAIMIASGRKKKEVIRTAVEGPVTTNMPASIIQKHPNGTVMLDKEAAALLGQADTTYG